MRKTMTGLIGGASVMVLTIAGTSQAGTPSEQAPISTAAKGYPVVRTIDERFQSYQIGFSHLTGGETWKSYDQLEKGKAAQNNGAARDFGAVREARAPTDLTSAKLRTLTAALAPLYIRYSGTTANSVYFHDSDTSAPGQAPDGFTVVLSRPAWKGAVDFARAVDAKIVTSFANSPGVRDGAQAWTPLMAKPWLDYTRSIGGHIYAVELFNEPNAPEPPRILKGHPPEEFARDYAVFRKFMKQAAPSVRLAGPGTATLGIPGVGSIGTTSAQYFAAKPRPEVDIVSYHFYPALAQRCAPPTSPQGASADQALSEGWLARPDAELQRQKALRDQYAPGAPIWLTETGGAACGGLTWQPTFLDVFRYVDMHARTAKQGLDAIFTHALISGSNGIIDEKTLDPNASYWAALLWRKLMGARVLDAGAFQEGLHLYAHCMRGVDGGVSLIALNLKEQIRTLRTPADAEMYALTSPALQSRTVLLNGKPLALTADDQLPALRPMLSSARSVALAPLSVNFVAFPKAANPLCTVD